MAEYRLANGGVITDEEIEAECEKYETGTWEGHLTDIRIGRPRLSEEGRGEPSITVPVKFPASMVAAIDQRTNNRSDFIRRAVAAAL